MDEIKYGRLDRLEGYIKKFYYLINNLTESNEILKELDTEKIINDNNYKFDIIFKRVPYCIPAAIVNKYTLKMEEYESDIFFSIIPSKESTDIIIIYEKEKSLWLLDYWRKVKCYDINILNMVESLMCGDEQWFIKPSIIKNKPIERVKIIEEDIYCVNERKFLQEYDVSIFDDLRRIFVEDMDEERKYKEIRKITDTLKRVQFKERKKNFLKTVEDQYMEV
ncbi:hypothetical protein [Clostridium tagluense]|uniref:hypothetical protein n=1 Tax=Clostridium tagluense TaxID=360422 RepID=UPI001C0B3B9F|nr:hypothetical protein [Clostridium tagluense]MBU3128486.1 hypothetical protein [Clostridium tagluense]